MRAGGSLQPPGRAAASPRRPRPASRKPGAASPPGAARVSAETGAAARLVAVEPGRGGSARPPRRHWPASRSASSSSSRASSSGEPSQPVSAGRDEDERADALGVGEGEVDARLGRRRSCRPAPPSRRPSVVEQRRERPRRRRTARPGAATRPSRAGRAGRRGVARRAPRPGRPRAAGRPRRRGGGRRRALAGRVVGDLGAVDAGASSVARGSCDLAEAAGERLQERPGDLRMLLDERPELPGRQPVAEEVGRGDDRGRADAVVDQRDLAEVVARAERGTVLAADRDLGVALPRSRRSRRRSRPRS